MPFTDAQVRLFAARAHGAKTRDGKNLSEHTARKLLLEAPKKQRSRAMRRKRKAHLTHMHSEPPVRRTMMRG